MKIIDLQVGPVQTKCYIVYDEASRKGFIVDPGDEAVRILAEVGQLGLDVQGVFVTHGHFDHIAAVDRLRASLEVPAYASALDAQICADPDLNCSAPAGKGNITCVIDTHLSDNEVVDLGWVKITALLLPGHTHGQMAYYLPSEKVIFTGDNLFKGSYGRYDLPTANFADLKKSLNRLLELPGDVTAYPGHGDKTTIDYENKNNPILRK